RRRHTRFSRDWSSDVCSSDLLWVNVTELMRLGNAGVGPIMQRLSADPALQAKAWDYMPRLNALLSIKERHFPIQEVTDSIAAPGDRKSGVQGKIVQAGALMRE